MPHRTSSKQDRIDGQPSVRWREHPTESISEVQGHRDYTVEDFREADATDCGVTEAIAILQGEERLVVSLVANGFSLNEIAELEGKARSEIQRIYKSACHHARGMLSKQEIIPETEYTEKVKYRSQVMSWVQAGRMSIRLASKHLGHSYEWTRKLFARYRKRGVDGLTHQLAGKPGNRASKSA